ncbi:rRNA-processing endoribonuclease [Phlyctochytrium bullatum]|nr:rRNA-processing endoribonuclease [Phlyctochytrium bullatum]
MEKITNGSTVEINHSGTAFIFRPGVIYGGKIEHDCPTSRGLGYFLEPMIALAPFAKVPLALTIRGVTNNNVDVDTIRTVLLPNLKRFLPTEEAADFRITKRGAPPLGGGEVFFRCPIVRTVKTIQLLDTGKGVKRVRGIAYATRISPAMANRMVDAARPILTRFIPDVYIYTDVYKGGESSKSPGYGLSLVAETTESNLLSAECVYQPRKSQQQASDETGAAKGQTTVTSAVPESLLEHDYSFPTPEDLGVRTARMLLTEIKKGGCVDTVSQWLAVLMMALGPEDVGKIRVGQFCTLPIPPNMMADMQGIYAQANAAFVDEDYDTALQLFSKLIETNPSSSDYFLKRATTYAKLSKYEDAANDATAAVMLAAGSNDLASKAYFRKGHALYELKRYDEAFKSLQEAKVLGSKDKTLESLLKSCETHLPKTPPHPSLTSAGTGTLSTANPPPTTTAVAPAKIRHEWFQNENFVTVSIFAKNTKKEDTKIEFAPNSLSVTVKLPSGSDYVLDLEPLAHEIVPSESKFSNLGSKIEIKLKKARIGVQWGTLEGEDNTLLQTMNIPDASKPAYPSSSKKKPNWDALAKSVEEEKPEGEAALNALFQQIYRDASEETRRAMVKSFVESNGTCLSTNWDEVGKGKVAVTPPDGMVAKKFEA